jgi:predicted  nucleic acid-binding Zn ribbon protein
MKVIVQCWRATGFGEMHSISIRGGYLRKELNEQAAMAIRYEEAKSGGEPLDDEEKECSPAFPLGSPWVVKISDDAPITDLVNSNGIVFLNPDEEDVIFSEED